MPQHARFSAYLCHTGDPKKYLLILCCSPCHFIITEVRRDVVSSAYTVISQGESTSDSPLNKADRASFHLPDTLTLINEENTFLTFLGDDTSQKSFPVLVESTEGIQSIIFFKFNNGHEEKKPLCTVQIVGKSPLQGHPGLPASKPVTSVEEPVKIDEHSKLWTIDPTPQLLRPLNEDLGTCWRDLGRALNLPEAELHNINQDCDSNKERAYTVIWTWKGKKGTGATMGHLATALGEIGKNDIAHKLIELLDQKENEGNEANHAQRQENKDQPRGESTSSIMSGAQDCEENDEENEEPKHSELKDKQNLVEEQEKQAEGSEILKKIITELQEKVKRNKEVVKKLDSDLKNAKELTKELQERVESLQLLEQKHKSLQDKVKQQEEVITRLRSDLENEKDLKKKLQQDLKSGKE